MGGLERINMNMVEINVPHLVDIIYIKDIFHSFSHKLILMLCMFLTLSSFSLLYLPYLIVSLYTSKVMRRRL